MPLSASGQIAPLQRLLLIHNPVAGRRDKARLARLVQLLRDENMVVTLEATSCAGDAERLAAAAADDALPPDLVIAAGGDGTANEVANGLRGSGLPMAVMPLGTVNVLARELGMPRTVRSIAATIAAGRTGLVWPGIANNRVFLLMAGIGFDAAVVAAVSPSMKRRFGAAAYLLAAASLWWRWQQESRVLEVDGIRHRTASALVARCRFYAGSYVGAHLARLDEPRLHLVLFEREGRLWALSYALALALGRLHRWPGVRHLQASRVSIAEARIAQLDGDAFKSDGLELSVARTPLRMICGADGVASTIGGG